MAALNEFMTRKVLPIWNLLTVVVGMLSVKLLLMVGPTALIDYVAKVSHKRYNFKADDPVSPDEALRSAPTWETLKAWLSMTYMSLTHNFVLKGDAIPDLKLHNLNAPAYSEGSVCQLFDFMKPDRPLVLNFGSCTLPPFTGMLRTFNQLVKDRQRDVDFLTVYIKEIHPTDGWVLPSSKYLVEEPKSIEERIRAAKLVAQELDTCPVVVDSMDNKAAGMFNAMPERLYVILDGKAIYKGRAGPIGYDIMDMAKFLSQLASKST